MYLYNKLYTTENFKNSISYYIKRLLEKDYINLDIINAKGNTALDILTASFTNFRIFDFKAIPKIYNLDKYKELLTHLESQEIFSILKHNKIQNLKYVITTHSLSNQLYKTGNTPLHIIIQKSNIYYNNDEINNKIFEVIDEEAINMQNNDGDTPLHLAMGLYASNWHTNHNLTNIYYYIKQLLEKDYINLDIENAEGKTALDLLTEYNKLIILDFSEILKISSLEIFQQILSDCENNIFDYIRDIDIISLNYAITPKSLRKRNKNNNTPLHAIIQSQYLYSDNINNKIFENIDIDILNSINHDGNTPLHIAAILYANKHYHISYYIKRLLLISNIDITIKNHDNKTILDILGSKIYDFKNIPIISDYITSYDWITSEESPDPIHENYDKKYQNITEISPNRLIYNLKNKKVIDQKILCTNTKDIFYIGNIVQITNETIYEQIKQAMIEQFKAIYTKNKLLTTTEKESIQIRTEHYDSRDKYLNNLPLIIIDIFDSNLVLDDSSLTASASALTISDNINCTCMLLEPKLFDKYKSIIYLKIEAMQVYKRDREQPSELLSGQKMMKSLLTMVKSPEYKKMEEFHKNFYKNLTRLIESNIEPGKFLEKIYTVNISCSELEKWEPMLIKSLSDLKSMNSLIPGMKLIEYLPTYILVAHGCESTKLPIKLEDNEYVIMNCNPHTLSWGSFMNMLKLFYTNPQKTKIQIIEEYFNIPSDNGIDLLETYKRKKQNFCVFSKKCPNLDLLFYHNCEQSNIGDQDFINLKILEIECNQFYKSHVFEFPVVFSEESSSVASVEASSEVLEVSSEVLEVSSEVLEEEDIIKLNNIFKENLTEDEKDYFIEFNKKLKLKQLEIPSSYYYDPSNMSLESTLSEEIIRIRSYRQDIEQKGFCLFLNSCRY